MKLLAAIDLSDATDKVISACRHVAQPTGARVWLLHVAEPEPDFMGYDAGPEVVRDQLADEYRREHRELQALADQLRQKSIDTTALQIQGPTIDTILREAKRLEVDLIVTGSHGRSALYDVVAGSVSLGILRKASVPVLVVPVRPKS